MKISLSEFARQKFFASSDDVCLKKDESVSDPEKSSAADFHLSRVR